ncbi:hypothetical protein GCM10022415_30830 [Knoellia locipacati]|uniref:Lipoprotein n=1 Tax=Knoellia locipacati TaxID=882824 RepID=A0A512T416_9MICO|nr:hypothetical protein [Knoellia locipacati]GEQ14913.1 hypothetical protein KLO01_29600 [Knoellia locipacati]
MSAIDEGRATRPARRRRGAAVTVAGAAATVAALLAGCSSGGDGGADAASSTAPATTSPKGGAAGLEGTAYRVPQSCGRLKAQPGGAIAGPALAACWGDALEAHGSVRAWTNGPPDMEAEVVLGASQRLRTQASDGRVVVVVDGASWSRSGDRWVAGVLNSQDEDEALGAATGEFAWATLSLEGMTRGVGECATWKVAADRAPVTLHDGASSSGLVRLDCMTPFEVMGATTTAASLWVRADWTPVRHASTLTLSGVAVESLVELTGHGTRFDIPVPA